MPTPLITESIVRQFTQGQPKAFRLIFDALHAQVYEFSIRFTKSPTEAEEVTQQVFIRLWEKRNLIDPSLPLENYVYKMTRNCAFNHLKQMALRDQQQQAGKLWVENSAPVTEDDLSLAECQQLTHKLIDSLPEKRQIIFRMHFEEGHSPAEIASLLGISQSTVKSQLAKATKAVKGYILNYRVANILAFHLLF